MKITRAKIIVGLAVTINGCSVVDVTEPTATPSPATQNIRISQSNPDKLSLALGGQIRLRSRAPRAQEGDLQSEGPGSTRAVLTGRVPARVPVELRSETRTFNHVFVYEIYDKMLWVRKRGDIHSPWRLIPFDAENGEKPVSIMADGANLMVLDSNGFIHYKKVLREFRDGKYGEYTATDLSTDDNWRDSWFSPPVVSWPSRLIRSKKLKLPDEAKFWSVSHRGKFVGHFEDEKGRMHPEFSMVTSVFAASGRELYYADPYLPGSFRKVRLGEEVLKDGFNIDGLDSSASAVYITGVNENGERKMFTRFVDFDLMGKNPFLGGFYSKDQTVSQEWMTVVPPVLSGYARISSQIIIMQTGQGNGNRELRIGGYDTEGRLGFYRKRIYDDRWDFVVQSL